MDVHVSVGVNITNGKGSHIVKQHHANKKQAYFEIEKLLISSALYDDGDEVAQFQADRFIADQFCMVWPKKKRQKEPIQSLVGAVAFPEQTKFQSSLSPHRSDDTHEARKSGTLESAQRRMLDILRGTSSSESSSQPGETTEFKAKELDSLLKESFAAYRLEHYSIAATRYKTAWDLIADPAIKIQSYADYIQEDVVCYMLCRSLTETGQLGNLLEALELLVALEKRSSQTFPAVYLALAKVHRKHYRFALALKAIEEGFAVLESEVELTKYTIPGSDVTLPESTKEGLSVSLATMKDECSQWHPPDAVCCMGECLPGPRRYGTTRDIYFSDPAFNGMVVLTCSNAENPCTMKFHQACWKSKKDRLSDLKKLSDKDVVGYECFTPNCELSRGNRSLIARVEVYGDDGKLKTRTEAPPSPAAWGKRRSLPKGAVPKQQTKLKRHSEKLRRPVPNAVPRQGCRDTVAQNSDERAWRLAKLSDLRRNNFGIRTECQWRPDMTLYGNPQMLEIGDFLGGPIFENDSDETVAIKTFVFTYFYEFIKESGCVKKRDISQKWNEDKVIFDDRSDALHTETDICSFLLQSYKLVSVGDYIGIAENLPELYAVVRSEVCDCLRFLLADPFQLPAAVSLDVGFEARTDDHAEREVGLSTVEASDDGEADETAYPDETEQKSASQAHPLQRESMARETVADDETNEPARDSDQLEARCAKLESEKLEFMHKYQESRLELNRRNEENVTLELRIAELRYRCDKLSEEKRDAEDNLDVLLKEKNALENDLRTLGEEKDRTDEELQKYISRLKDKSVADAELASSRREEQSKWEKRMLEAEIANVRKLKLKSLDHEFGINTYALERAIEKCHDNIRVLNDASKLVALATGRQLIVAEAQSVWQETGYRLHHTVVQYKEDYFKLKTLLESDLPIENWNRIALPTLNVVLPQPADLTELYATQTAKSMSALPNLWSVQGSPRPSELCHWVNDACRISTAPSYLDDRCPAVEKIADISGGPSSTSDRYQFAGRNSLHPEDTNDGGQSSGNAVIGDTECPVTVADAQPSTEVMEALGGRATNQVSTTSENDAEYDDRGVSQSGRRPAALRANLFEGASQISAAGYDRLDLPRRSCRSNKIGTDVLIQELRKKFVGVPELDLLESVQDVRESHHGTLSGMRVEDIVRDAAPFVRRRQDKHMAFYLQSKRASTPDQISTQPNEPGQRKIPSSALSGQQKDPQFVVPERARRLADHRSKLPATAPATPKKQAWEPVKSGFVEWTKNDKDCECPICFEPMSTYDRMHPAYALPCQHSFHTTCIRKWLGETSVCPICRMHCTMDDEFPPLRL